MTVRRRTLVSTLCATIAAVGVGSACGSHTAVTPTGVTPEVRNRIVVLGDSLAVSPTPDASFPAVLQKRLTEDGLPWTITNAGIRGDTTGGGRRRLGPLLDRDVGILVLALGANDGLHGVDLDTIEDNLSDIIKAARDRGITVLLCGMETPPLQGLAYSLNFHTMFRRLASTYGVPLVPFLLTGVVLNPDLNGNDLIHPNEAGARQIADNVWPYLEPLLAGTGAGLRVNGRGPGDRRPMRSA